MSVQLDNRTTVALAAAVCGVGVISCTLLFRVYDTVAARRGRATSPVGVLLSGAPGRRTPESTAKEGPQAIHVPASVASRAGARGSGADPLASVSLADLRHLPETTLAEVTRKRNAIQDLLDEKAAPILLQRFEAGLVEHVTDEEEWRGGDSPSEYATIYGLMRAEGRGWDRTVLTRSQYPDLYQLKDETRRLDKLKADRFRTELLNGE